MVQHGFAQAQVIVYGVIVGRGLGERLQQVAGLGIGAVIIEGDGVHQLGFDSLRGGKKGRQKQQPHKDDPSHHAHLLSIFSMSVYKNNTKSRKFYEICVDELFSRADETFLRQIASNNLDDIG